MGNVLYSRIEKNLFIGNKTLTEAITCAIFNAEVITNVVSAVGAEVWRHIKKYIIYYLRMIL